ncbi:MAG: hypothetical protein HY593_05175 [Candidatus Omnitrophica bacterium]|nr:hypothetical protein [Candidatus Omnitrophota bacterium]
MLQQAGLTENDLYFDVQYRKGMIVLIPMQVEEKIPVENLERFKADMLKKEAGDREYRSVDDLIRGLHSRHPQHPA